jgi:pimeloyl-ACP methyl ester carboxylesterase
MRIDGVACPTRLQRGKRVLADSTLELAPPVRLSRHVIDLDDGHRVGVAVAGRGVPFVVVHGFGVESLLYAQPLARLAALGFRVVAIDVAGHGSTDGLGAFSRLDEYGALVQRALVHLGIRRAVLVGHSLGGRLVTDVAATDPDRVIALVLVDAIVGAPWERWRCVLRWSPPALAAYAGAFALDALGTMPVVGDAGQALKLGSRAARSMELHVVQPWRSFTPAQAILRAGSSLPALDRARASGVCAAVIHGDHDMLVPIAAGRDTAERLGADFVMVRGGGHSWLLRCPETLPAIIGELLERDLGAACARARAEVALEPSTSSIDDDRAFLEPDALVARLGGEHESELSPTPRFAPRHEWTIESAATRATEDAS